MSKNRSAKNFEASLQQLERIVREMEAGDLPLERSLELFERGVRLSRECQEQLNDAERRIETLIRDAQGRPVVARGAFGGKDDEDELTDEAGDDDEDAF